MPDAALDELHTSTAALIGSLEIKLEKVANAVDQEAVRLARDLQQLLKEIHALLR
jgi:hypothetical protein